MNEACQFPGCENDATATYCEECQKRVIRAPQPPPVHPLYFVLAVVITGVAIAAVAISVLMYWRVI